MVAFHRELGGQRQPLLAAELAPGVIAVKDAGAEYDVTFDTARWQLVCGTTPSYGNDHPMLKDTGLETIWGGAKHIGTATEALAFARLHLSPKVSTLLWNAIPEFLDIDG